MSHLGFETVALYITRALANQSAAPHLRQLGRLSGNHALAATGEFYSHSRVTQLNTNTTVLFSLRHIPASFVSLWPSCHSDLGGSSHDWELFLK